MSCVRSSASSPSDKRFTGRERGIAASPVSRMSSIPRSGGSPWGTPPKTSAYSAFTAVNAGSSVPASCSSASTRQKDARWSSVPSLRISSPVSNRGPAWARGSRAAARPGCRRARAAWRVASSRAASSAWSAWTGRDQPVEQREGMDEGPGGGPGGAGAADTTSSSVISRSIWRRSLRNSPWLMMAKDRGGGRASAGRRSS